MDAIDHTINRPFSFSGGDIEPLIPEAIAETHAKICGSRVNNAATRRRAVWWRKLPTLSDRQVDQTCRDLFLAGCDTIDALFVCADKDETALASLALFANQILDGLLKLTAAGKRGASEAFLNSIGPAVNNFELLATRKPEIFRGWARRSIAIPGVISRNPAQSQDNEKLLDALEQGEDSYLGPFMKKRPGRPWAFERANTLAVRAIDHISRAINSYASDKVLARHVKRELPRWRIEAAELKSISAENWQQWAKVSWNMIAEVSPEKKPARHPGFYDRKTKICEVRKIRKNPYGKAEQTYSVREHDIKEALFGAFELLATSESRRTKERRGEKRPVRKTQNKS